jgi:catalase
VKDPKKFGDFIHTQKRDPHTNMKSPTMMWDYWSLNPESIHQVLILMSDRGTPYGYRHMHGFGSHTYSMINEANERFYVKFHFITAQGIKNFTDYEASKMKSTDMDFSQRDLFEHIENRKFPKWNLKIQVMTEEEANAEDYYFNPFDLTKVWPHANCPLIDVGELELNRNPENYFQDIEQLAFAPAHIVDGIGYSPDKMLQGRLLSYPDAQRYRLGVNYEEIPVNRCPFSTNNYQRDGQMRVDGNGGSSPNYYPNSFDKFEIDNDYKEPHLELQSKIADWYDRNSEGENNHFTQPGNLFRLMTPEQQKNTISNIVGAMSRITGPRKHNIINLQLSHWYRVDGRLGTGIADGLGVEVAMMEI